jgi:hypothetical protein
MGHSGRRQAWSFSLPANVSARLVATEVSFEWDRSSAEEPDTDAAPASDP